MHNEIMNAVTVQLEELFGDGYTIYTYASEQGLYKPCFFVGIDQESEKPLIGSRYCTNTKICIKFFTDQGGSELAADLNRVAKALMNGMECITEADGRKITGTQRKYSITDNVLIFFVNYHTFGLKEISRQEPMDQLETKGAVK